MRCPRGAEKEIARDRREQPTVPVVPDDDSRAVWEWCRVCDAASRKRASLLVRRGISVECPRPERRAHGADPISLRHYERAVDLELLVAGGHGADQGVLSRAPRTRRESAGSFP